MSTFIFKAISTALDEPDQNSASGVDFSGKSLKLDSAEDAQPIIDAINSCMNLQSLTLTGNTLGVAAAESIAGALANKHELAKAHFSDMFTGRMKTEIPPALSALGDGMIRASARLQVLDLSDNAFGPIGVQGLAKLLQSEVCAKLQELRLNNNGLGITGGKLLATALNKMKLKTFIAGRNRLENEGAIALAKVFKAMGTLEELSMPQNGIYSNGLSALADALENNKSLTTLNLNDNTIGKKGAICIAKTLPRLKNLRSINFGDCLLKSKGALVLATAFKNNSQPIQSIDMSHNEISHAACLNLAQALTAVPGSGERLERVVLAGNFIGGPTNRDALKNILGECAVLSDDGESDDGGSDDEVDTEDSEEDESEEEKSGESGDNAEDEINVLSTSNEEDVQPIDQKSNAIFSSRDDVIRSVKLFFSEPSYSNLCKMGSEPAVAIDTYLETIPDPQVFVNTYVDYMMLVSSLAWAAPLANMMYSRMANRVSSRLAAVQWTLADAMLRGLGLIKREDRQPIRWHLPSCYEILADNIADGMFPAALRSTLRLFINSQQLSLPDNVQAIIKSHPILLRDI